MSNEWQERKETLRLAIADAETRIESNPNDTGYVQQQQEKINEWALELVEGVIAMSPKPMSSIDIVVETQLDRILVLDSARILRAEGKAVLCGENRMNIKWIGGKYDRYRGTDTREAGPKPSPDSKGKSQVSTADEEGSSRRRKTS